MDGPMECSRRNAGREARRGRGGLPGRTAARTNRPPTSAPKRARCGHGDRFAVADALHEAVVRMLTSER
jgi:hypothetical protein